MNKRDVDTLLEHYIVAALWSSLDGKDKPLDENYTEENLSADAIATMRKDCEAFLEKAKPLLDGINFPLDQAGHDFWLTRNRHGVGFWDRDLGEIGEKLSDIAQSFGTQDLYISDGTLEVM